jgi:putative tricarboxylic transport membrane protein
MRRVDFCTGVVSAAVGLAALWDTRNLAMFGEHDVPGSGFFPTLLAGLLTFLGLVLAGMALRQHASLPADPEATAPEGAGSARHAMLRPVAVLIAFGVIAPLVAVIGYVPAMVLLVLVVLYGIERRRDLRSLLAAVLIPVATFLLFSHLFAIPLPAGPLLAG